MPTGAFYGAKKGCEPLQLVYDYGDNCVYFVGTALHGCPPLEKAGTRACPYADIQVYDIESKSLLATRVPVDAERGTSQRVFELPPLDRISTTYFLSLRLRDADGKELGNNLYWLSTKPDVLDYEAKVEPWEGLPPAKQGRWGPEYYTPSKEYADLTMLNHLTPTRIDVAYRVKAAGRKAAVELTNRSDKIAFFIELLLTEQDTGEPLVPVFWQDNYVSLLPHETRTIAVAFPARTQMPLLTVRGWNIEQVCRTPVRA
jgi:exo-1,4-beta-D-glucosaminidase